MENSGIESFNFNNDMSKLAKECRKCGIWFIPKEDPGSVDNEQEDGPHIEKVRPTESRRHRGWPIKALVSWPSIRILKKVRTSYLKLRKINIRK